MDDSIKEHPSYDAYKKRGMTDFQIREQIETDAEMQQMEDENNASIQATIDAEERDRNND